MMCRNSESFSLGMYLIAIFKTRPEPDSSECQTNYPAGTGYLNTCCTVNFLFFCVV